MKLPGMKRSNSQTCVALETTFAVTAFILMWIGSIRCNFIKFTDTAGTSEPVSLQFGIWYYQFWSVVASTDGTFIFESCHGYPSSMVVDSAWKTARAFSVLTFISALIVFITSVISACATDSKLYTKAWLAPAYMLTCICQGLTLLVLESSLCNDNMLVKRMGIVSSPVSDIVFPDTCEISTGAKLCISATAFWFAAGVASYTAHKAEKAEEEEEEIDAALREPLTA